MERTVFTRKKKKFDYNITLDGEDVIIRIKLAQLLDFDRQVGSKKTSNKDIYIKTNNILGGKKTCNLPEKKAANLPRKKNKTSIQERTKNFLPLAQLLSEAIFSARNIQYKPNQIAQWADEIRKLSEGFNVDCDRIEDVLEWYKVNIKKPFVPIIFSGFSFRMKFFNLEAAIEREKTPNVSSKPKIKYFDGVKGILDDEGSHYVHPRTGTRLFE